MLRIPNEIGWFALAETINDENGKWSEMCAGGLCGESLLCVNRPTEGTVALQVQPVVYK